MKVLHLADIHFDETSLADLEAPCKKIIEYVEEHEPDLVVIAGDLTIHRGNVSNSTAVAVRAFVEELLETSEVWILDGNHDITHKDGEPSNSEAIFKGYGIDPNGQLSNYGCRETGARGLRVVTSPERRSFNGANFTLIPYPSAATFYANTGQNSNESLSDALDSVVKGYALQAKSSTVPEILIYHGSVIGARQGDEASAKLVTRGEDVSINPVSLEGFDGGMFGHLHHPQAVEWQGGTGYYSGCVAPLTFGEREIEPIVMLWEIFDDTRPYPAPLPLPVAHQRIQVELGVDQWKDGNGLDWNLCNVLNEANSGCRAKIKALLPKSILTQITEEHIERVRYELDLHELRIDKTELPKAVSVLETGVDRAARVDIPTTIATWAETLGEDAILANHLDEVRELATEIEAKIQDSGADPSYDFTPLHLTLSNYKSIAEAEINLAELPARFGVFGATGIGKSNLLLAIFAALYGVNPKSEEGKAKATIGDMVKRGETKCMIVLEFWSHGQKYRITREIKVNSRGTGSSKLFLDLYAPIGGDWRPESEGTSKETQAAIVAMVGPASLYWLTRHLRQHGKSAIKSGSSDLADDINSTLQFSFEEREKHGKTARDTAEKEALSHKVRHQAISELLVDGEVLDGRESETKRFMAGANSARDIANTAIGTLEDEHGKAVKEEAITSARLDSFVEVQTECVKLSEELSAQRFSLDVTNQGIASLGETPAAVNDNEVAAAENALKAEGEKYDVHVKECLSFGEESTSLSTDEIGRFERQIKTDSKIRLDLITENAASAKEESEALSALWESCNAAQAKKTSADNAFTSAKRRLADLRRDAELLTDVPCGGKDDFASCKLLEKAINSKDGIKAAIESVELAMGAVFAAEADFVAADEECQKWVDACKIEEDGRDRAVGLLSNSIVKYEERLGVAKKIHIELLERVATTSKKRQAELRAHKADLDKMQSIYNGQRELQRKHLDYENKSIKLRDEKQILEKQIEEKDKKRDALAVKLEGREETSLKLSGWQLVIKTTSDKLITQRLVATTADTHIGKYTSELEQIEKDRKARDVQLVDINMAKEKEAQQERNRVAATYYLDAVKRDGIPSLLLSQLAPQLEYEVNQLLEESGRKLTIETERTLTTGKAKTEVTLKFTAPSSGNLVVPIAELSGGEEDIMNVAWAVGLAKVSCEMRGIKPSMIILDEPFTGVSADHDEGIRETIKRIQERVPNVAIITHKEDLKPMVDKVIQLTQGSAGAIVEVI